MKCIIDIETDSLNPTKIWCIVCKDISSGSIHTFKEETLQDFNQFNNSTNHYIAHNGIGYDIPNLNRLLGCNIKNSQVTDTVVLSRLFNPTRLGGHSLENFGKLLRFPKGEFNNFSQYSDEMLKYCIQDVELTYKVYNYLMQEGRDFSPQCIKLEHSIQYILQRQKDKGFYLDQDKAYTIRQECLKVTKAIEFEIEEHFRPKPTLIRHVKPKTNKDGSLSKVGLNQIDNALEVVVGEYSLIEYVPFNMSSPSQVVGRMEAYGWKPVVFNKPTAQMKARGINRGTPKICPENIDTLPDTAPLAAKRISTYLMCSSRAKLVDGWFQALGEDGRVHGTVFGVGANTHRMAHISPNMANIPSLVFNKDGTPKAGVDGRFGFDCRDCFTVDDVNNRRLVGVDAKAIQLRVFAHYVNDAAYTDVMVNGDVHQFNREALGLGDVLDGRAIAKTFIYAFLLGGGDAKLGQIVGGNARDGTALRALFMDRIKGIKKLKDQNEEDARKGYFIGLDGRRLPIKSAHFALSSYLQGGESVIMKMAYVDWFNRVNRLKLDAYGVAIVHDEFQVDSHKDVAEQVGNIIIDSIRETTRTLSLNCPMDGEAKIGVSWSQAH